ncbi:IscS subfamily cysteine desulfurase [Herbaspirillum sp. RTI4]|uniref:IscS subfamily cysteine desulfurase n=1 Tax=Herbaspirillum sp. RTI4 TaxID=3048640 RepID=UPI002AB46E86|nr:IscS subfamily cysteine desulfurase [Herbaspirillum sp. RTI4]MDY7578955.1 IscS subfamily cysteine desulfurase [Herbaspirillum sp. RTI4]MEA9980886.1 IscS subfamily cysteine desulfurase [Herbaspirillum sp. RTI4]
MNASSACNTSIATNHADTDNKAALHFPIYLDYSATTPVDPSVAAKMCAYLTEKFGNPASSSHSFGWEARAAVEKARKQVAGLVGAQTAEIVWTSGATESNNLALKGAAHVLRERGRGKHLVTVSTEHKAVLDTMHTLERDGFEVTYLQPGSDGLITTAQFTAALRPDTLLASVMMVNNEIGVIQPIAELGEICAGRGIVFHVDAVQAAGKIPIDLRRLKVDLMSFSAHKVYGPKGIGALFVRHNPDLTLEAQIDGGGHENGMRSGTLATHQIVGMGEAFALAALLQEEESARIRLLHERLWEGLRVLPGVLLNGSAEQRIPNNLNLSFDLVGEVSVAGQLLDIAVSAGSACNSANAAPSYVLSALGRSDALARNAIRISLGRYTTMEEIDYTVATLRQLLQSQPIAA